MRQSSSGTSTKLWKNTSHLNGEKRSWETSANWWLRLHTLFEVVLWAHYDSLWPFFLPFLFVSVYGSWYIIWFCFLSSVSLAVFFIFYFYLGDLCLCLLKVTGAHCAEQFYLSVLEHQQSSEWAPFYDLLMQMSRIQVTCSPFQTFKYMVLSSFSIIRGRNLLTGQIGVFIFKFKFPG